MSARWITADVFDGLATLDDGSIDLVVTSPPFLALRSYLPADHPDKSKEIGSEATPAEFIDTLLAVTAELRRVLAPHGSICVELGDTYAGSGGAGGDYAEDGLREGQPVFKQNSPPWRSENGTDRGSAQGRGAAYSGGEGWPQKKSRALIPQLYEIALAYGRNPLRTPLSARELVSWFERIIEDMRAGGFEPPATDLLRMMTDYIDQCSEFGPYREYERWRIRNVVTWARPNPPVGALGDKWRPATSDLIVACTSAKRYWDDLATRKQLPHHDEKPYRTAPESAYKPDLVHSGEDRRTGGVHPSGAPLLDYWVIPPGGYEGAHYAVFPPELVVPCVKAMCPEKVCRTCGEPSRKIVKQENHSDDRLGLAAHMKAQREARGISRSDFVPHFPHYKNGESVMAQVSNWELAKNVPSATDWPILVNLLDLSDEFVYLIEGTRQWTESLVEYEGGEQGFVNSREMGRGGHQGMPKTTRIEPDAGWSDCGHDDWRSGLVLDPFAGSGTTLAVATGHGHDAIGIDLDPRNADLARDRIGPLMFEPMEIT